MEGGDEIPSRKFIVLSSFMYGSGVRRSGWMRIGTAFSRSGKFKVDTVGDFAHGGKMNR